MENIMNDMNDFEERDVLALCQAVEDPATAWWLAKTSRHGKYALLGMLGDSIREGRVACRQLQSSWAASAITRRPLPPPSACSLLDPECEACQ